MMARTGRYQICKPYYFFYGKMILLVWNDLGLDLPFFKGSPLSDPSMGSYDHVITNMLEFRDIWKSLQTLWNVSATGSKAKSISLEREWWTKFSDGMPSGILLKSNLPYQARRKLHQSPKHATLESIFKIMQNLWPKKVFLFKMEIFLVAFWVSCNSTNKSLSRKFHLRLSLKHFSFLHQTCGGRYGCHVDNEPKYLCLKELPAILKLGGE